jgi:hypothetical protein
MRSFEKSGNKSKHKSGMLEVNLCLRLVTGGQIKGAYNETTRGLEHQRLIMSIVKFEPNYIY